MEEGKLAATGTKQKQEHQRFVSKKYYCTVRQKEGSAQLVSTSAPALLKQQNDHEQYSTSLLCSVEQRANDVGAAAAL